MFRNEVKKSKIHTIQDKICECILAFLEFKIVQYRQYEW